MMTLTIIIIIIIIIIIKTRTTTMIINSRFVPYLEQKKFKDFPAPTAIFKDFQGAWEPFN